MEFTGTLHNDVDLERSSFLLSPLEHQYGIVYVWVAGSIDPYSMESLFFHYFLGLMI